MCRHGRWSLMTCFTLHPWREAYCLKTYFMGIVLTACLQLQAPAHICQSTTAPAFPSPQDPAGQNLLFHLYGRLWPSQTVPVGYWREPAWTCRGETRQTQMSWEAARQAKGVGFKVSVSKLNSVQNVNIYLLLCSPVRYKKAFKVALRSSLIFSCTVKVKIAPWGIPAETRRNTNTLLHEHSETYCGPLAKECISFVDKQ